MKNKNIIETAWNMWKVCIKPNDISTQLCIDRATIYRWINDFKYLGLERTLQKRSTCKSRIQPRKINQVVKNRIYKIRIDKHNCCGEKIRYYYTKEYGKTISVGKIYLGLYMRIPNDIASCSICE